MTHYQLERLIEEQRENKAIGIVMEKYNKKFELILKKYEWKYINTLLEKEDIINLFMFEIPRIIKNYSYTRGASFNTYIGNEFRNIIFKHTRRCSSRRYKILNNYIEYKDDKYSISNLFKHSGLNFSTFTEMEYSVYLWIFEANRSIAYVMREYGIPRYKVEKILTNIKLKIKKQL